MNKIVNLGSQTAIASEKTNNLRSQNATIENEDSLRFQNGTLETESSLRSQFVTLNYTYPLLSRTSGSEGRGNQVAEDTTMLPSSASGSLVAEVPDATVEMKIYNYIKKQVSSLIKNYSRHNEIIALR